MNLNGVMLSEYRREHVQLLKINFLTRDHQMTYRRITVRFSRPERRVKKERLVAQLFEKLLKINVRKQALLP